MQEVSPAPRRSILARTFVSSAEPRLRAGWRLLLQTLLMVALLVACVLPIAAIAMFRDLNWLDAEAFWVGQIAEFLALLVSIYVARRFLDRRSFSSLGIELGRRTWQDLLGGIGISFAMMAGIFGLLSAMGWLTVEEFAWRTDSASNLLAGLLGWLVVFFLVGWNEELWFRGYLLQTIASGTRLSWGILISSLVFGAAHLGNPNSDAAISVMLGIFLAGLLMAYGYARTKSLWLPIGLHIGWNYFEGVIFGFPVSGLSTYRLLHVEVHGPIVWTGGPFGPEAGLILLPAVVLGFLLIYLYPRGRAGAHVGQEHLVGDR